MTVLHFCSGSMFKNILILTRTRTKGEMRLLRLQRKNPLSVRNNFQNDANENDGNENDNENEAKVFRRHMRD